jgi:hypothetical protein
MGTILILVLAALAGAVGFYFFLRANPKKSKAISRVADALK